MKLSDLKHSGHWPTLLTAFLYFDVSFMIGVTLYQALTSSLPHGAIERFRTPVFATAKGVTQLNANVPHWLENVIARAIATDPQRRYQHYSDLMFDLANPTLVQPFFASGTSLLERNPLAFYKPGFFVLLALVIWLALQWLNPS